MASKEQELKQDNEWHSFVLRIVLVGFSRASTCPFDTHENQTTIRNRLPVAIVVGPVVHGNLWGLLKNRPKPHTHTHTHTHRERWIEKRFPISF